MHFLYLFNMSYISIHVVNSFFDDFIQMNLHLIILILIDYSLFIIEILLIFYQYNLRVIQSRL